MFLSRETEFSQIVVNREKLRKCCSNECFLRNLLKYNIKIPTGPKWNTMNYNNDNNCNKLKPIKYLYTYEFMMILIEELIIFGK